MDLLFIYYTGKRPCYSGYGGGIMVPAVRHTMYGWIFLIQISHCIRNSSTTSMKERKQKIREGGESAAQS